MRQALIVQAKAVQVGDTMLWDRPERTLWLTVTDVAHTLGSQLRVEFELPFIALEGLDIFHLYDPIAAWAIDTDRQVLCLCQYTDPDAPLQNSLRRTTSGFILEKDEIMTDDIKGTWEEVIQRNEQAVREFELRIVRSQRRELRLVNAQGTFTIGKGTAGSTERWYLFTPNTENYGNDIAEVMYMAESQGWPVGLWMTEFDVT